MNKMQNTAADKFNAWLANAKRGERYVYADGVPSCRVWVEIEGTDGVRVVKTVNSAVDPAWFASQKGFVLLCQKVNPVKSGRGWRVFDYIAVRA